MAGFWVALVVASLGLFTALGPFAWLVLLTDGFRPLLVLTAAAGWGAWPTRFWQTSATGKTRRLTLAVALGSGFVSLLTLGLGLVGWLGPGTAWALIVTGIALGLAYLYRFQEQAAPRGFIAEGSSATPDLQLNRPGVALTAAIVAGGLLGVPAAVMFSGACLPPSVFWTGEARGYDALEYHLQAPREWFDAGRIEFLPHNVYASFPQQVEMQYLLLMHLEPREENGYPPHAAAIPCQILHAWYGVLVVLAIGAWCDGPAARIAASLAAGTMPWLAYVGCLAYVENGVLFFAAVAAGLVRANLAASAGAVRAWLGAGLCAGLAGACKYQGLAFVAASLGIAALGSTPTRLGRRWAQSGAFGLGVLLAISPWLARNAVLAGNPVYPFAYSWFGGKAWSAAQAEQWQRGHALPPDVGLGRRLALAAGELIGQPSESFDSESATPRFGVALFLASLLGLAGWKRRNWLWTLWALVALAGWIFLTHLPGRFAMPLVIPLALAAGESFELDTKPANWARWRAPAAAALLAVSAILGGSMLLRLYWSEGWRFFQRTQQVPMSAVFGRTHELFGGFALNRALPANAGVRLIGPAAVFPLLSKFTYTVAFNRDPWLEFCAQARSPQDCIDWLRERSVGFVVFDFDEIERLRRTYGFADVVTPGWVAQLTQGGLERVDAGVTNGVSPHLLVFEVRR